MRQKVITFYEFSELSEEAKAKAKLDHGELNGYPRWYQAWLGLSAVAQHFQGKLEKWSIDYNGEYESTVKFNMPNLNEEKIRDLLSTISIADDFVKVIVDKFKFEFSLGEVNLNNLMQSASLAWIKYIQTEYAKGYEDETFSAYCDACLMEFYENGSQIEEKYALRY